MNFDDAPGEIHSVTHIPGEEVPYLDVRTKLLDMQSTKPLELIVLNGEQIALREMRKCLLKSCPVPITMHGERVDCIYFTATNPFDSLFEINEQLPDTYKITTERSYLVPDNAKSEEEAEWLQVFESSSASTCTVA